MYVPVGSIRLRRRGWVGPKKRKSEYYGEYNTALNRGDNCGLTVVLPRCRHPLLIVVVFIMAPH